MGRDRKNETKAEHFAQLMRPMLQSPAWRALPVVAQALYPWLKLEWKGPRSNNNGMIALSVRQAGAAMGVNPKTAAKGYHALQAKGFLVCRRTASLGIEGEARSPEFELTELPLPGQSVGRKLFLQWQEAGDFPVARAAVHNPQGRNRKRGGAGVDVIDLKARRT